MSGKHTQGPWATDDASPGDLFRHVLHGVGDSFGYVCRISTNGNANAEADARLIAAAPELLEALQEMVEFFQPNAWGSNDNKKDALDNACAAIAKATGEPQ